MLLYNTRNNKTIVPKRDEEEEEDVTWVGNVLGIIRLPCLPYPLRGARRVPLRLYVIHKKKTTVDGEIL